MKREKRTPVSCPFLDSSSVERHECGEDGHAAATTEQAAARDKGGKDCGYPRRVCHDRQSAATDPRSETDLFLQRWRNRLREAFDIAIHVERSGPRAHSLCAGRLLFDGTTVVPCCGSYVSFGI
jgi:hypothetical protein